MTQSLFVHLSISNTEIISVIVLSYPRNNFECGKLIIDILRKDNALLHEMATSLSKIKTAFPTKHNQNKFMLGMGTEYIFVETLCRSGRPIASLCGRNETRVDVNVLNKFRFSLKYSTPRKCGTMNNIRLINKHCTNEKNYAIEDDIFVIVPSCSQDDDKVYDIETGKFYKCTSKKGLKVLLGSKFEDACKKTKELLSGKLVFIPCSAIDKYALKHTQDGIELSSSFLNNYISNPSNAENVLFWDVKSDDSVVELDIIRIGVEAAIGRKLKFC